MIRFKTVRFKNFLSYGNQFTEIFLDYAHTTVLVGDSGAGKSAITDAISFALFNKPFRPINKNQLVNAINNGDCLVEIEFEVGKNEYLIRRGIKPNIFEIYKNAKLINQEAHNTEYQNYLERNILNLNFKTFSQIVVLGAVNFTPFMGLKPNDRRLLIEDLLDIQIFTVMNNLLKQKTSDIRNKITQTGMEINVQKEHIELYQKYLADMKKDREKKLEENVRQIQENKNVVTDHRSKISDAKNKIDEFQKLIPDCSTIYDKRKTTLEYYSTIESNLKKIRKDLKFYSNNDVCPTCGQEFKSIDELVKHKEEKEKEYLLGLTKLDGILEKISIRCSEIEDVQKKIEKQVDIINHEASLMEGVNRYIQKLESENEELQKVHTGNIELEETKIQELKNKLDELENQKSTLAHNKLVHEIASNLLKDGGIKSLIIKQYLPIINRLINKFLSAMNFYVTFKIDENFQETIKSRGRDIFTYSCFSEGERQRLDLAILLTWRTVAMMKNSVNTNLLFIDEIFDSSLDQVATENIIELINTETILKNSNIFIISHKTHLVDKFSEYIKFEKHKSFSRIVTQ